MEKAYQMYIDGEWVNAIDGGLYEDFNPYTGEVFAKLPAGGREDARRAVEAAREAFPSWSRSLPAERQALFLKAADILEKKQKDIDSGKQDIGRNFCKIDHTLYPHCLW